MADKASGPLVHPDLNMRDTEPTPKSFTNPEDRRRKRTDEPEERGKDESTARVRKTAGALRRHYQASPDHGGLSDEARTVSPTAGDGSTPVRVHSGELRYLEGAPRCWRAAPTHQQAT